MPSSPLSRITAFGRSRLLPGLVVAGASVIATAPAHAVPVTTAFQNLNFCVNCGAQTFILADDSAVFDYPAFTNGTAFNQFNASLGTLQRVELVWTSGLFGTLADEDGHYTGSLARLILDAAMTLNLPGSVDLSVMTDHIEKNGTIAGGKVTGSISQASTSSRNFTAPADLTNFVGNGTFGASFALVMTQQSDNGTKAFASWGADPTTGNDAGVLSLRYVYDDGTTPPPTRLPEPGSGVLAAVAALLGLAGSARALKRRK